MPAIWTSNAGNYGTDYEQRAMVTLVGPGLNFPQDALYPFSEKDADGKDYDAGTGKEANWLPAPKGKFIPTLRLYWPRETPPSILDGSWTPPPLRRAP
jgi:hypothetical protein